ncbi:MAG: phosphate ABC transporter substrate-binding protein PstS family protein [Anaerolineae bacterium]|nr:phosphate ABC transporter substrate-binding protein PstS family protein [Anaerolineae bacterium]
MNRKRLRILSGLLIGLALITLAACKRASETSPTPTATPALVGRITFAGSTTVQPLADKIGQAFRQKYPGVELEIAAGGSVVGIQAVHDGAVDIGMASRALTPEEAEGIEQYQIAMDVIAVVVNQQNPVDSLTMEQLAAIYQGKITNWKELGGPDLPILAVVREQTSGTRGAFDELVLHKQEPAPANQKIAVAASEVVAAVTEDPAAIGYVGFGHLEPALKALKIGGVPPTEENARTGAYPLVRPLLLLTGPLTQPIAKYYIDFALSPEGQQVVTEAGWVAMVEQR